MARNTDWQSLANQAADARTGRAQPRETVTRQIARINQRQPARNTTRATNDFWNRHPSGLPPAMTAAQKDWLAANLIVFSVHGIKWTDSGDFGPTWWADIEVNGQRFGAPFAANSVRDQLYSDLQTAIIDAGGPIMASMMTYDTARGAGFDLCAPYDETEPETEPDPNDPMPVDTPF